MTTQRAQFNIRTTSTRWQVIGVVMLGDQIAVVPGVIPGKPGFRPVVQGYNLTGLTALKNDGSTGLPTVLPDPAVDGIGNSSFPCWAFLFVNGVPIQIIASNLVGGFSAYKRGLYLPSGTDIDLNFQPVNGVVPNTGPFSLCYFSIWGRYEATPRSIREQLFQSASTNGAGAGYIADDVFSAVAIMGMQASTVLPGTPPSAPVPIILPSGAADITGPPPNTQKNFQEPLTSVIIDSLAAFGTEGSFDGQSFVLAGGAPIAPVVKETTGVNSTVTEVLYPPMGGLTSEEIGMIVQPTPYLQLAAGNGFGIDLGILPQTATTGLELVNVAGRLRPGAEVADMVSKTLFL